MNSEYRGTGTLKQTKLFSEPCFGQQGSVSHGSGDTSTGLEELQSSAQTRSPTTCPSPNAGGTLVAFSMTLVALVRVTGACVIIFRDII